ncbi:hypothetical protein ACWOEH_03475 [Enterococcus nangangensis]
MVNFSAKEFHDYNDYHDRGMMKWVTAYALDELVKGIQKNHQEAARTAPTQALMAPEEIDALLQLAFQTCQPLLVYCNTKDEFGRFVEPFVGYFYGEATAEKVKIAERWLPFATIRALKLLPKEKWFHLKENS